jgi:hypothetical protein
MGRLPKRAVIGVGMVQVVPPRGLKTISYLTL